MAFCTTAAEGEEAASEEQGHHPELGPLREGGDGGGGGGVKSEASRSIQPR